MKLKKIQIENFRPYEGSHKLEFATSAIKNVTILSAENNYGKTSLFEAVKWCLYDELPPRNRGTIINKNCLRRLKSKEIQSFDVRVILDFEHDNQHYRAQRTANIESPYNEDAPESYLYLSGVKHDGSSIALKNSHDEYDFKKTIDQILPKSVSQYFIVDGDKIKQFTNPTSSQTKEAIEHLLKLNRLFRASNHLEMLKKQLVKQLAQKKKGEINNSGANLEQRYQDVTDKLKEEIEEQETNKNNFKRVERMLSTLRLELADATENSELQKDNQTLNQLNETDGKLKDVYLEDLTKLITLGYLVFLRPTLEEVNEHLEENRKKGRIPKPYDEVFLKDLLTQCDKVGEGECICGTKFKQNDKHYKKLKRELSETPPKSISDIIQPLQKDLSDGIKSEAILLKQIGLVLDRIDEVDHNIEGRKKKISENQSLIDEKGEKDEPALIVKRDELVGKKRDLQLDIRILAREIESHQQEAEKLEKKIRADEKIDLRTRKLQRKIDIVENTQIAVEEVHEKYRKKLKNDLEKEIDKIFLSLFTAKERFKGFVIDEDYNYDVISREGESWKFFLSNAQRKLLAFSFVAGLRKVAEEEAPFVLDSPLGIVDTTHRKNYANTVPSVASQLIMLITSSEETNEISDRISEKIGAHWKVNYDPVTNRSTFVKLI